MDSCTTTNSSNAGSKSNQSENISLTSFSQPRSFDFPLPQLRIFSDIDTCLNSKQLFDVKYLSSGSNSDVYTASWNHQQIVVKMLKSKLPNVRIAKQEMAGEMHSLMRLCHPNIVSVYAAGEEPRPFIVLEHLEGGTLDKLLNIPSSPSKSNAFKCQALCFRRSLLIASELASALNYLHTEFSKVACIIHRDLKPQNIGFTAEGKLKLFDFGLMACVRKRTWSTETYKMTGNTGTLAYMAPEVALRKAYNEKVDIYSFGMILWQMLHGEVPFRGLSRDEHFVQVVRGGLRPTISSDLPPQLRLLLELCWHADYRKRPSCEEIIDVLSQEIDVILHPRKSSSPTRFWAPFSSSKLNRVVDENIVNDRNNIMFGWF